MTIIFITNTQTRATTRSHNLNNVFVKNIFSDHQRFETSINAKKNGKRMQQQQQNADLTLVWARANVCCKFKGGGAQQRQQQQKQKKKIKINSTFGRGVSERAQIKPSKSDFIMYNRAGAPCNSTKVFSAIWRHQTSFFCIYNKEC